MKLNNRQLVDKYQLIDAAPPPLYGAVNIYLINVYFTFFIYFIVEHNNPKRVRLCVNNISKYLSHDYKVI